MYLKHLPTTAIFIMLAALPCIAQKQPSAEVSGGFSYLHLQRSANLYGWDGSLTVNLNTWLGLTGEFSGHYGQNGGGGVAIIIPAPIIEPPPILNISSSSNVHTFLFGPRVSYRKSERLTPFGHVLPGFARSGFSATITSPTINVHTSSSSTGFAMAVGGGLDLKLSRSLAFRLIQADYLLTHFSGTNQNNARITTGLVFRF